MVMRIAFIGSRKLSENEFKQDADLFYRIAKYCAKNGIIMRSGGAVGADYIAETAYRDAIFEGLASEDQVEIYTAWKNFQGVKGVNNPLHHLHIVPSDKHLIERAESMVREIHPIYKKPNGELSQGAMKLHSRNMNQVFGLDLETPIQATICWTENGLDTGGTRSAIMLCRNNGIPVFNIGGDCKLVQKQIKEFLNGKD